MNIPRNFANNFHRIPNPSKIICNHLIGREHRLIHRVIVGIIIMVVGVYITKWALHSTDMLLIHVVGDTIGFLIHGVGAIPIVEVFLELDKNKEAKDASFDNNNDNDNEYKQ